MKVPTNNQQLKTDNRQQKTEKQMKIVSYILLPLLILMSCTQERQKPKTLREVKQKEETLEDINRYLVRKDEDAIRNHCKRHGWNMTMKKSGLWYGALHTTDLDSVKTGNWVDVKYRITLLDGTEVYNSDSLGIKTFSVGHGGVESGLEEGILMMKRNEKYRFIMPPHKAHGLMGDLKGIPPRSTIVYYVEILDIR